MPELFFTWALDARRRVHYEFLDNSVGEGSPLTIAFGWNGEMTIVDIKRMLDIDRFRKINIHAQDREAVYSGLDLAPQRNLDFLQRCSRLIPVINFADRASGRVYARLERGRWTWCDEQQLARVLTDPDARAGLMALRVTDHSAAAAPLSGAIDLQIDDSHNLGALA
jgi:hypothetical protein